MNLEFLHFAAYLGQPGRKLIAQMQTFSGIITYILWQFVYGDWKLAFLSGLILEIRAQIVGKKDKNWGKVGWDQKCAFV